MNQTKVYIFLTFITILTIYNCIALSLFLLEIHRNRGNIELLFNSLNDIEDIKLALNKITDTLP